MRLEVSVLRAYNLPHPTFPFSKKRRFYVVLTSGNLTKSTTAIQSQNWVVEWNEKLEPFDLLPSSRITLSLYYQRSSHEDDLIGTLDIPLESQNNSSFILARVGSAPQVQLYLSINLLENTVLSTHVASTPDGACVNLMQRVVAHESYRRNIYDGTVFARGLPPASVLRKNINITTIFREVIENGSIIFEADYLLSKPEDDDDQKAALRKIFCYGWLHTEAGPDTGEIMYTFSSPLHKRCVNWMITGLPLESGIAESNLLEFALAVIQNFSPQSLNKRQIGPRTQSIPEGQFQDEFYRASFEHANGSVSFPESGTKTGRIDFFIQSKKWGVELLRDGNRLAQHAQRFTAGEYSKWFNAGWMSDYIIIDFRTRRPRIVHKALLCCIRRRLEQYWEKSSFNAVLLNN